MRKREYEVSVLGEQIWRRRHEQRMRQKHLAESAGITAVTLYRVETGELQDLLGATVVKIARALGSSVEELYGYEAKGD